MNASAPAADRSALDAAITTEREETKYLITAEALGPLTRSISQHLSAHRFTGEAANLLPGAHHYTTTIYFDTPSLRYLNAARHDTQCNVKVRAKEYYDLHPSLAELATDPEQILRYQTWLWFELKQRNGAVTTKRRFRFPKAVAATLFAEVGEVGGVRAPEGLPDSGAEREDAEALIAHVRSQTEPVRPSAIVNYRRLSFQNSDATLRVTIDFGLSFFSVPPDLFRRTRPLSRGELGVPAAVEPRAVVEIKQRGRLPAWLTDALAAAGKPAIGFSKFVAASEAVHGA